jgi:hypothetical protein
MQQTGRENAQTTKHHKKKAKGCRSQNCVMQQAGASARGPGSDQRRLQKQTAVLTQRRGPG